MRELPGIDAIPAIVKPSEIAFSFNFLVISFMSSMVSIVSLFFIAFLFLNFF